MKKKKSLSAQLILTMICLVAGAVILCWFLNNTFLERYYMLNKQNELSEGYRTINKAAEDGTLDSEQFDVPFEKICTTGNIIVIVIGQDRTIIRSSTNNSQLLQMQLNDMMFGTASGESEILETNKKFSIERQKDSRMDSENLALWGRLDDGSAIYMKTALESIRESAQITNTFFKYIGLIALAVSFVVIVIVSNSISRPIMELSELSRKMTKLDFEAKYHPGKQTAMEIDALGSSMNELSETLEQTISELKRANNELQQDIEKKEQIDEMRKEFLSNVSHELKTPLALIQGYAEGLQECINDDEESRDFYCEVIMDETGKMNRMVKKLLTLNQLEFGNDVVEMDRFDMTELIQGVINASAILAAQQGITINFYQNGPVYVWGDEFKVEEVITNYISNAMNHAEGEKRIDVRYSIHGENVRISVFNTGKPIPEEDLDKIWIKFYKVDKARTREYGGSGIGLSIVKAIMDSFHKQCGAVNHTDGVEFWMELELK